MCQPPGLAGSSSGSAHTASSKSRASLPSIVTSASPRRSVRPAVSGPRGGCLGERGGRGTRRISKAAIVTRLIAPGAFAGPSRSTMRTRLPKRRDGSSSATTSSSSARAASWPSTWYSPLSRRSAGITSPPSRVRRKTPTMRLAWVLPGVSRRRMISASISPESRRISRASARSPGPSSSPAVPTRRKLGASPSPDPSTGRASGKPSASLPKRSTGMISGSAAPATNLRLPARSSSPDRPTRRSMSRNAGCSAAPSPKARAISRVPSAPGLSRRNSISASGEGRAPEHGGTAC